MADSTQLIPPTPPKRQPPQKYRIELRKKLKAYAWRATATLVWIYAIQALFFERNFLGRIGIAISDRCVSGLFSLGFTPVKPEDMWRILKVGWFLLITGFSAPEIVGLAIYILFFPITALYILLLGDSVSQELRQESNNKPGLRKVSSGWPLFALSGWLVLSWFLLFGEATTKPAILVGLILAGLWFLVFSYRQFRSARPSDKGEVTLFNGLGMMGLRFVDQALDMLKTLNTKEKLTVNIHLKMQSFYAWFFRSITLLLMRGKRARDRVALFLLLNYIFSLAMLGVAAIFFWALALKYADYPSLSPFGTYLQVAAAHFLPGMQSTKQVSPIWTEVGTSATAWILFVLFAGPAATLLPETQRDYVAHLRNSYKVFRKITLSFRMIRRVLKKALKSPANDKAQTASP